MHLHKPMAWIGYRCALSGDPPRALAPPVGIAPPQLNAFPKWRVGTGHLDSANATIIGGSGADSAFGRGGIIGRTNVSSDFTLDKCIGGIYIQNFERIP